MSKEDVGRRRECGGVLGSGQPHVGPPEASSVWEGSGSRASHQPASLLHAADSQDRGLPGGRGPHSCRGPRKDGLSCCRFPPLPLPVPAAMPPPMTDAALLLRSAPPARGPSVSSSPSLPLRRKSPTAAAQNKNKKGSVAAPQPPPLPLLKIEAASERGVECGLPGRGGALLSAASAFPGGLAVTALEERALERTTERHPPALPARPGAELVCKPVSIFSNRPVLSL